MQIWNPSYTFTRPNDTTAYTAGDLVANNTTAGSVVPMSWILGGNMMPGCTRITRVRMSKSSTTQTAATFKVHLYAALLTPANGDNGAYSTDQATNYLGNVLIDMTNATVGFAFSAGAAGTGAAAAGSELLIRLPAGQTVYGLVQATGAYVPTANETFTVVLEDLSTF